jgi:hypothetical protein
MPLRKFSFMKLPKLSEGIFLTLRMSQLQNYLERRS